MNKLNFKEDILPHLVALAVFFTIVIFFFKPAVFDGKQVIQNDILQWEGSAKEIIDHRAKTGEEALWTNSMFGGMPAYLISTIYTGELTKFIPKVLGAGLPNPADQIFFAMICFYILLLCFRVNPYLAIAGAIAYAFNSYNIINIEAGHNAKGWAIAAMPLVLAGVHLAFGKKRWLGVAITGLALAIHFGMGHLQITYYLMLLVMIYGVFRIIFAVKNKEVPHTALTIGALAIAALLALGANFGRIWTTYEYGKYSIRGASELRSESGKNASGNGLDKEYAFAWSNGISESFTLLIPNFYGGGSRENVGMKSPMAETLKRNNIPAGQIRDMAKGAPTYWGDQPFTSGPIYAGAIVLFLFVLGMFLLPNEQRWWLLAGVIFSLLLSWGKNLAFFNYFMFDYFPGYNKFRAVSMALSIALMLLPLGAILGLQAWMNNKDTKNEAFKSLVPAYVLTGGLSLFILIISGLLSYRGIVDAQMAEMPGWYLDAIRDTRQWMLQKDAFRSFILIALAAALAVLHYLKSIKSSVLIAAIIALISIDQIWVSTRYLDEENYAKAPNRSHFNPNDADTYIKEQNKEGARVLYLLNPWNDARTSYHHASIGGYHGAKMRRYQDLIDRNLNQESNAAIQNLRSGQMPDFLTMPVLNMLNTRYLIAGDNRRAVITNEEAFGKAWLATDILTATTAEEEIGQLSLIRNKEQVVVQTGSYDVSGVGAPVNGSIKQTYYAPNELHYDATLDGTALAVFSEIYYPAGWKAYVNGAETEIYRVNYSLRALKLPAGQHEIKFVFKPKSYYTGNTISMIASIILLAGFGLGVLVTLKTKE